jgi:iron complex outermembrane receptor protein
MRKLYSVSLGALALALSSGQAMAQSAENDTDTQANPAGSGEILVTARKRSEAQIDVPVVITAVGGETLTNLGVTNLDGLARLVPQLLIGNQGGAVQGGNINIRGIEGPDQNPFGDSAVSFNIDGLQVSRATVRRMSDFDIAQIEVLKGPQALFYGKNSPAGIITINTADPTDAFEAKVSSLYEFHADQLRLEGYVSTPLTDSLGLRIAGVYSDMQGDLTDVTPRNSPFFDDGRNPTVEDWALRGTLKFDNGGPFDARLKVGYGTLSGDGPASVTAFTSCPFGNRFSTFIGGTVTQCNANDGENVNAGYGGVVSQQGGDLNLFREDGRNFNNQDQVLASLQLNYELGAISLTSVTGYYKVSLDQCQNYENDATIFLPSCNVLELDEFSQELRFFTDFDGLVNFSGGAYFADTKASTGSLTYLFAGNFDLIAPGLGGPNSPFLINNYFFEQDGRAYSGYAQAIITPTDNLELSVGGRYTREEKSLPLVLSGGGASDGIIPGTTFFDQSTVLLTQEEFIAAGRPAGYNLGLLARRDDAWNDFSPEVTLSYRPSDDINMFVSYKEGFLSGGFNSGSVTFNPPNGILDLSYAPQRVDGIEAGIKSSLLEGDLLLNFAAYKYNITDQQVTVVFNATNSITNAGGSEVTGVEFDATYRTPLEGLNVNFAAAYNDGIYTEYSNAPCYGGQTPALGCVGGVQNLGGTELVRAPDWNLNGGFDYTTPVSDNLELSFNGNARYVSSYLTDASSAPNGRQPSFTLFDATARLSDVSERWELALIGRNLTNEYYVVATSLVPFAFDPTGTGNPALLDRFGSLSRGREVALRVSYRFGN